MEPTFNPDDYKRPIKLSHDLVIQKIKRNFTKGWEIKYCYCKKTQKKIQEILISNNELVGKYVKNDIKDKEGNIIIESGHNFNDENLQKIISEIHNLEIINIDPINKSPYLLETLKLIKIDKNNALNDIYKVSDQEKLKRSK